MQKLEIVTVQTKSMKPDEVLKLLRNGVGDKQLDAITQQVTLIRSDSDALNDLRRALAEKNRDRRYYGKAAALYREVANGDHDPIGEARILEADCLVAGGQAAAALKALELVPAGYLETPSVLNVRGRALEQLDHTEEAINCYLRVLRSGQIKTTTLHLLVQALIRENRHDEAVKTLDDVLWDPLESTCRHASLSIL